MKFMETLGERLNYLIESEGDNRLKFCEKHGLNYNSISPIINNKRDLGMNILNDLKHIFPTLNTNWLLYGEGSVNLIKNDLTLSDMIIREPSPDYGIDPVEMVFLEYLDKKSVRNKLLTIVKNEK